MKTALLILCCFLGLLTGCEEAIPSSAWKEYKLAEASFSVKLPGPPTERKSTLKLPPGNADQHTFSSSGNGSVYKVMYVDYPDSPMRMMDPDSVLDNVCEGSAEALSGHVSKMRTISLDANRGRDFVIETSDGKPSVYCRYYMVNNRLIQMMAIKKQSVKSAADINVFLLSLKLLKNR
jgi:hypothetical protein